ncbi:MAG: DoxX family protein [Gemmatimonadaceae bacterium]|nr:DoxX family protein [Gemmatimonadaceae bacterium]
MQLATTAALVISSASFAWYGIGCLVSEQMVPEFERYRLGKFRTITGVLQVAASIGLIAGYFYRPLLLVSAAGLATMMFLAVLVRLRIRDPLYLAIPALVLFCINAFIVWSTVSARA